MKQAIFAGCLAVMMLLSLSLFLLRPEVENPPVAAAQPVQPQPQPQIQPSEPAAYDEAHRIEMTDGTQIHTLQLSDYLIGVVLAEMPASFEPEALKAQAVAARTFALRQSAAGKHAQADLCASGSCCQQYADPDSVRQKLGDSYERYVEKVRVAVAQTDGLVLRYQGELIDAVYFSCSGGRTESAAAVWGGDVPYLTPVDSPGEEGSTRYSESVTVPEDRFREIVLAAAPTADLTGQPAGWFGAVTRTGGGGVAEIVLGGASFAGTKVRSLFSLRSTNFTVSVTDAGIVFDTLGNGHRVGMSQYGAQAMAEDGSDFQAILTHYYTGAQVEQADS